MCGIVGIQYWDRSRHVRESTVAEMCRAIVHRGPDDQGVFVDGNLGMGMRRLSIIDLAGGQQPMSNEDGAVTVVYNGEIYNHNELRKELEPLGHKFKTRSDTEVLVHGYETWGEQLPQKLNGMFAYSIWDSRKRRLVLARDHLGIKPLYVYRDEEKFAWASEIKALFTVPGIEPCLDELALLDFITFGYVPAPRTLFRGISKVLPASRLTIEDGKVQEESFWDVECLPDHSDAPSWCEQLRDMMDNSVRRQLMSDVPLGAFLSGGIDSSAIVATMHRLGVDKISTYSIGFTGQDAFHSELDKASIIARQFNTDHHEIAVESQVADLLEPLITQLDEPITDTSFLVTYLVSKLARETVTVILSGVGGDEIFAGYRRYLGPRLHALYRWMPGTLRRNVALPIARRLPVDRGSQLKSMFRYMRGFVENAEQPAAARYQGYVGIFNNGQSEAILTDEFAELRQHHTSDQVERYYDGAPAQDPLDRMLYADIKTALADSLLAFTDKMSMAVSLETRVPLLDRELVEMAFRIPPSLKLRGLRGLKYIFKQAMSDRLPPEILHRKKQGFGTPISRWFRGSLRPLVQDLLSPDRIRRRNYFNPAAVTRLIDDHLAQRADYSEHILALLTFEIWHANYID